MFSKLLNIGKSFRKDSHLGEEWGESEEKLAVFTNDSIMRFWWSRIDFRNFHRNKCCRLLGHISIQNDNLNEQMFSQKYFLQTIFPSQIVDKNEKVFPYFLLMIFSLPFSLNFPNWNYYNSLIKKMCWKTNWKEIV